MARTDEGLAQRRSVGQIQADWPSVHISGACGRPVAAHIDHFNPDREQPAIARSPCHCKKRSDEAISRPMTDCFVATLVAMTDGDTMSGVPGRLENALRQRPRINESVAVAKLSAAAEPVGADRPQARKTE